MTGDPPLLFSRSWRRNFKDPRRGQKHSLGPLIITTGVPLFGRGALSRVQNCSAGVPREAPFTSSRSSRSLLVVPLSSSSPFRPRSIDLQISSSPPTGPIRAAFINIFVRSPRHGNDSVRGIIESSTRGRIRAGRRAVERGIAFSRSVRPLVGAKRGPAASPKLSIGQKRPIPSYVRHPSGASHVPVIARVRLPFDPARSARNIFFALGKYRNAESISRRPKDTLAKRIQRAEDSSP